MHWFDHRRKMNQLLGLPCTASDGSRFSNGKVKSFNAFIIHCCLARATPPSHTPNIPLSVSIKNIVSFSNMHFNLKIEVQVRVNLWFISENIPSLCFCFFWSGKTYNVLTEENVLTEGSKKRWVAFHGSQQFPSEKLVSGRVRCKERERDWRREWKMRVGGSSLEVMEGTAFVGGRFCPRRRKRERW